MKCPDKRKNGKMEKWKNGKTDIGTDIENY